MIKLDRKVIKDNRIYFDFLCNCGNILLLRSDVGKNRKDCGCSKNIKYHHIYKNIISLMQCDIKYSEAVKLSRYSSCEVSKAFKLNGGMINSYNESDIYIDNGILFDKRHNVKINTYIGNHGYLLFNLKGDRLLVHRFIASRYLKNINIELYTQVNHKNGIKTDNRVENLEWCTPYENINHAFDNGLNHIGSKSYNSKLSEDEVLIIRNKISNNEKTSKIAKEFNVSPQTICDIKYNRIRKGRKNENT